MRAIISSKRSPCVFGLDRDTSRLFRDFIHVSGSEVGICPGFRRSGADSAAHDDRVQDRIGIQKLADCCLVVGLIIHAEIVGQDQDRALRSRFGVLVHVMRGVDDGLVDGRPVADILLAVETRFAVAARPLCGCRRNRSGPWCCRSERHDADGIAGLEVTDRLLRGVGDLSDVCVHAAADVEQEHKVQRLGFTAEARIACGCLDR